MQRAGSRIDKRGNLALWEHGRAIDQDHMAADAECWTGAGDFNGFGGCGGTRHKRRARENAGGVQLGNGAVDSCCQAKIVGVDNKTAHDLSLSTDGTKPSA